MAAKTKVFLVSTKNPALRYEVLAFDAATQTATLQGKLAPFEVKPFTKEKVIADGYTLQKEEVH